MELKLINKTDTYLELEVKGENETLLNLMKQKLLENEKVVTASYLMRHPLLDVPKLVVETKGVKADAAVKTAAKELRQAFDDFESQLSSATGQ